ncbi:LacI family DNA-binding transcriptional regulator [Parasulfitobacter algicola]|uniref:LacI family DNA-binding transcriptional regulator n=1 Tax=Parasulfitobacter algicola TaxID=2614809 RepID=A0ABX2IR81_9RHOB|nr:LacI family DNA-binding transcriptional regulator [Sulfitobacter algicola]NSX55394.1 LacI family DNA-binding transcriptional regulator [Sulfitobacter algicola]
MNKRATIGDVAKLAGVSTATVSRVIHTPDLVTDSTRKAVYSAISQTNYTLNLAARNLRQQRSNAIVVLVPDIGNTFFSEILAGIERVASSAGQTILIGHTAHDHMREEKYLNNLLNSQADGALLLNGHLPASVATKIGETPGRRLPIVSVSEALADQIVPHVGIDNDRAAALVTQYLLDHGHRRIVHLRGPVSNILTCQRAKGFARTMKAAGLQVSPDMFLDGDFTIESGIAAASVLIAAGSMPDAVLCANDEMAIGLMSRLAEHGIHVPQDVSVVGFDDIAFSRTAQPALTTIHQPRAEIGERATRILLELIAGDNDASNMITTLPVELVERASVALNRGFTAT